MIEFFYLFISITLFFSFFLILFLNEFSAKLIALIYSIFIFLLSILALTCIDFSSIFFYSYSIELSSFFNIFFVIGIDQLSIMLIILVTFLFPLSILASWNSIKFKIKFFYFNILLLEFFLINVFLSFDLLFFYFWFESTLIPMFFIIVIWGNQSRKINAAFYLVAYTLVFSTFFFIIILFIHFNFGTTNVFALSYLFVLNKKYQLIFWLAFFLAFAVKLPIFPFHLWLPEAHVEAPTVGSILLAGLLLKLGYYGYARFFLHLFPLASIYYNPLVVVLCSIGCIYGALLALGQLDIKKIVAYSSVSHMSLCILGLISNNIYGILGSFLLAIGHGFVSSALFFLIGVLYDRYHTRILDYYSGIGIILPVFSFFFFSFLISNFGFPISLNFISELLILIGIGSWSLLLLFLLLFYSVLSVSYNLWLYVRVCHGTLYSLLFIKGLYYDMSKIEFYVIMPLFFCNIFFCFAPNCLINLMLPFFLSLF